MLVRDVADTFVTHARLVHDITDTDTMAQNGSTHSHVLATFKNKK